MSFYNKAAWRELIIYVDPDLLVNVLQNNFVVSELVLRPLVILGMGAVILGSVLLLLFLTVRHKAKVDPLFYGTVTLTHAFI